MKHLCILKKVSTFNFIFLIFKYFSFQKNDIFYVSQKVVDPFFLETLFY